MLLGCYDKLAIICLLGSIVVVGYQDMIGFQFLLG